MMTKKTSKISSSNKIKLFVRNFKNKDVFPLFKKALFAGNEKEMKKQYKRFFKSNGKTKSLARNKFFKKYFLDK